MGESCASGVALWVLEASDKAGIGGCSHGYGRLSGGEGRELTGKGQGGFAATGRKDCMLQEKHSWKPKVQ